MNLNRPRTELGSLLNELGLINTGVELGVWQGESSDFILRKWMGQRLYSIDCWEEQSDQVYQDPTFNVATTRQLAIYRTVCERLSWFGPRSVVLRTYSGPAASIFRDGELDFVYFDANHSHSGLLTDLTVWIPKIRKGGLAVGDDVGPEYPGVATAVAEFFKDCPPSIGFTDRPHWLIQL